ncbi:unnamed protein product [Arctogadus glacialis]
MCPQGARLGLGQGFRNAPQETPVKAGAGLEECSSGGLREWRLAGADDVERLWGMAEDQVSVWGSSSCRQGSGLPWGAGQSVGQAAQLQGLRLKAHNRFSNAAVL